VDVGDRNKGAFTMGKAGICGSWTEKPGNFWARRKEETLFQNVFTMHRSENRQRDLQTDILEAGKPRHGFPLPQHRGRPQLAAMRYDPGNDAIDYPSQPKLPGDVWAESSIVEGSGGTAGRPRFFEMPSAPDGKRRRARGALMRPEG